MYTLRVKGMLSVLHTHNVRFFLLIACRASSNMQISYLGHGALHVSIQSLDRCSLLGAFHKY